MNAASCLATDLTEAADFIDAITNLDQNKHRPNKGTG